MEYIQFVSDLFTIAVIIGNTSSTHCFNNFVGMGSNMHDELLLVKINDLISFEVVGRRIVNLVSVSGCSYISVWLSVLRCALILAILL